VEAELEIAISQVILSVQAFQRELQAVFFRFSSTVPKMSMGVLFDLLKMHLARLVWVLEKSTIILAVFLNVSKNL